jgi:hypothetical protein
MSEKKHKVFSGKQKAKVALAAIKDVKIKSFLALCP